MFCLLLGPAKERNFEMTINVNKIDGKSLGRLKSTYYFLVLQRWHWETIYICLVSILTVNAAYAWVDLFSIFIS
jgi:hypothetical protein